MDVLLYWASFLNRFAQMKFLKSTRTNQVLTKSAKKMPRSNKINQRNGKHKLANAACRNGAQKRRATKMEWVGGGVTPHGVFNPIRVRRRPGRVCASKNSFILPASIPIKVLVILCRFMIGLGSRLCNCVKVVDGCVVVLGILSKQIYTHEKS